MPDGGNSTLSSSAMELDCLLAQGLPPVDEPTEEELTAAAHELAMAVVYTWLNKDYAAQAVFLDQILNLHESGIGLALAVDALTAARLLGLRRGMTRSDATITLRWEPQEIADHPDQYAPCVAIITEFWTGLATSNMQRMSQAKEQLLGLSPARARDVLRFMAFDIAQAIEYHTITRTTGAEAWEDYRRANPPDSPASPDSMPTA
jgi:hypothetical protein